MEASRYAGIDYGEKRMGVSISDPLLITARPLTVIERTEKGELKNVLEKLREIAVKNNVALFVVGSPKNMNNTVGPLGHAAEKFAKRLERELTIPVVMWDERLTSAQAERLLLEAELSREKRKERIDGVAAAIILQSYLDCPKTQASP